jgi:16S rRNA (adenine(1408)-N(1))-methyltransferase
VIIDLGTGDGRAALAAADVHPDALVLGLDADTASMAEVSRRAARAVTRGGRPNLLFVAAAAEAPPVELHGVADEIRILFPWGSLLRGVLGRDAAVARGIAALAKTGAGVTAFVSVTSTDRGAGLDALDGRTLAAAAAALAGDGLMLVTAELATPEEVRATRSTWGRRLLAGARDRPVWRLELRSEDPPDGPGERRVAGAGVSSMD